MERPPACPDWLEVWTAAERPDLWAATREDGVFGDVWPEYNLHGIHTPAYFGALVPRFAELQALLVDRASERVVARARTIPFRWDGTLEDLPAGIDALGLQAVRPAAAAPNALSALAAEVARSAQGRGLSAVVLATMVAMARAHGLGPLVAPVRPSHKDRHPLTPIERYAAWCRADGLPVDPWLRVHVRLGARVLRPEPRSLHIVAPVGHWEDWTAMAFPDDGDYVFPGGLASLSVAGGEGDYWEPNVWVVHDV